MTCETDPPKKDYRSLRELVEVRGSDLPDKVFISSPSRVPRSLLEHIARQFWNWVPN